MRKEKEKKRFYNLIIILPKGWEQKEARALRAGLFQLLFRARQPVKKFDKAIKDLYNLYKGGDYYVYNKYRP